jgi:hypothetical protein
MSENAYRAVKALLLTALVVGGLFLGWRFAENGRYVQLDPGKRPAGGGNVWRMDTRTGHVLIDQD